VEVLCVYGEGEDEGLRKEEYVGLIYFPTHLLFVFEWAIILNQLLLK
jgi:hypothetical protein